MAQFAFVKDDEYVRDDNGAIIIIDNDPVFVDAACRVFGFNQEEIDIACLLAQRQKMQQIKDYLKNNRELKFSGSELLAMVFNGI